MKESETEILN